VAYKRPKPPAGTPIDWNNPITRGLFFVVPCNEMGAHTPVEILSGRLCGDQTSTGSVIMRNGEPTYYTNGDGGIGWEILSGQLDRGPLTVISCYEEVRTDGYGGVFQLSAASGNPLGIGWSGSETVVSASVEYGPGSPFGGTYAVTKHARHVYAMVLGPTSLVCIDGAVVDSASLGANAYLYPYTINQLTVGGSAVGGGGHGYTSYSYTWSRALSAAEILSLYNDPYQIFVKPSLSRIRQLGTAGLTASSLPPLIRSLQLPSVMRASLY
jgi:hypothetical protein